MSARGRLVSVAVVAALVGCGASPRRPLFSFDPTPTKRKPPAPPPADVAPQPIVLGPQGAPTAQPHVPEVTPIFTRSATRADIDRLVAGLRSGKRSERAAVLRQLVALGDSAKPDLERASEDATFETDLLHEAILRIDEANAPRESAANGLDRKKPVPAPWVEQKYRLALDKFLVGDALGAQAVLDAVLLLEPSSPARPRLERLRRQVRDQLIADTVVAATIAPDEPVLGPGQKLRAKVVLENRCREEVVLRPAPGSPLGAVIVDYEELRIDGTRTMRRATRPVPCGIEVRLGPGRTHELTVELPTEHSEKPRGVIGRYRLSGRLRPYTLLAGEEPLPYFLPLPLVEVIVLDADELALATKPQETFERTVRTALGAREAAKEQDLREAFISAVVWASASRDEATAGIVKALDRSEGRLARTLCSALARAVGEPGTFTKDEWLSWWRTNRSRPKALHAPADEPDEDEGPGAKATAPR